MQYNGNEIYATRYMKSLFLSGRRWIGYFRLYLTGVRYFLYEKHGLCFSLPSCLRYVLHMFTAFETDLLCIWSINWIYSRKESLRFLVKSLSGLRQNMEWISSSSVMQLSSVDFKLDKKKISHNESPLKYVYNQGLRQHILGLLVNCFFVIFF